MNTRPLVTIAIPTYNRADKTLRSALEAALAQDYPSLEIIVSDNCSTDQTESVVRSYDDARVRYIRQRRNLGPTGNYNALLDAAEGDYFLLLHDDDLIDADFVSTCLTAAEHRRDYGFIMAGARLIDASGQALGDRPNLAADDNAESLYRAWLTAATSFFLCSTLFNTQALRSIGGWHSRNYLFEDGIAIIKIAGDWPILNLAEPKASCRQHPEQRTHSAAVGNWCEDFREAIDLICSSTASGKAELYRLGMERFSRVGLRFARRVDGRLRRAAAVMGVSRSFPVDYWPRDAGKVRLLGHLGSWIYPERRPPLDGSAG